MKYKFYLACNFGFSNKEKRILYEAFHDYERIYGLTKEEMEGLGFLSEDGINEVLRWKDRFDLEGKKQQAKEYISTLMKPTLDEIDYMERFMAKEYKPELLFEDAMIIERIRNHPMALWKCK